MSERFQHNQYDKSYLLISALMRSLSHKIRTPLSVISNELQYFQANSQDEGYGRALKCCSQISDILSEVCRVGVGELKIQNFNLQELVSASFGCALEVDSDSYIILGDSNRLSVAFELLKDELNSILESEIDRIKLKHVDNIIILSLFLESKSLAAEQLRSFYTLTEFFESLFSYNACNIPLIDLIFMVHGVKTMISMDSTMLEIVLQFSAGQS